MPISEIIPEANPLEYHSLALEASKVIKASSGKLVDVKGHNNSSSAQYIQIHDAAALPANGVKPKLFFRVGPHEDFPPLNLNSDYPFVNGIVICNSSTPDTKTIGAADCWFNVLYT